MMACSPLLLAFSASAFTDMLMLLGMVGALWLAAAQRPLWAGVWLAFAFASKQQARITRRWFWECCTCGTAQIMALSPVHAAAFYAAAGCRHAAAAAVGCGARADTGLFALLRQQQPLRWVPLREIPARIGAWWSYLVGYCWAAAADGPAKLRWRCWRLSHRPSRIDALPGFIAVYSGAHWLIRFNIYDRYLLLLLPPCVLLAARGMVRVRRALPLQNGKGWLAVALCLVLLLGALPASEGNVISGRADDSILQVADFLNGQTLGAIIYDRWIGWELGYYLGQWTDKRKVYYPTPDMLAAGALAQPDPAPRYFVTPANRLYQPWLDVLRAAGFHITLVYDTPPYLVFRLIPSWAETGA
ncbi:MAG: hypothetical protein U0694_01295 [Anaerolineae bacterium]